MAWSSGRFNNSNSGGYQRRGNGGGFQRRGGNGGGGANRKPHHYLIAYRKDSFDPQSKQYRESVFLGAVWPSDLPDARTKPYSWDNQSDINLIHEILEDGRLPGDQRQWFTRLTGFGAPQQYGSRQRSAQPQQRTQRDWHNRNTQASGAPADAVVEEPAYAESAPTDGGVDDNF